MTQILSALSKMMENLPNISIHLKGTVVVARILKTICENSSRFRNWIHSVIVIVLLFIDS